MARPVTIFTGQWTDLSLEEICKSSKEYWCRNRNLFHGISNLEDSRMERVFGGTEACEFTKRMNFSPSDVTFDDALKYD